MPDPRGSEGDDAEGAPLDGDDPRRAGGRRRALLVPDARTRGRASGARRVSPDGPCQHRRRRAPGRAGLCHRARIGAGLLHHRDPFPGGRHHAGGAVHRRAAREEGRRARQDRSAPLPGGARPGQGEARAGCGAAHLGREGPAALENPRRAERRDPAARRPAAGAGRPAQGLGRGRRGGHRDRADPARLHADQIAERRAHRRALGRSRQSRPRLRRAPHRHRGAHAAVRGDVHAADAGARRSARSDGARPGRGDRVRPEQPPAAQHRHAPAHRQHHRPVDRDAAPQGDVRQHRRAAVARRIRQCAGAARRPQERHRAAEHGGATRPEGPVRLGGHRRQQGGGAPDRARPGVGRPHGDLRRHQRGRPRRHRRPVQAAGRCAGRDRRRAQNRGQ